MAFATLNNTCTVNLYNCCSCGTVIALEENLERGLRKTKDAFYCPNGHSQVFTGTTEAEKLRHELKRKEQELANKVMQQIQTQAELDKANRKLRRVHNGTCPCCKRNFKDLQAHMKTKHPELLTTKNK
jgi:hypothetical protein